MHWIPLRCATYVIDVDKDMIYRIPQYGMVRGITIACGAYFGSQEREFIFCMFEIFQNKKVESFEYQGLHITNFEMESSALAGLSALMGHKAMTCCMVIANRLAQKANTGYKNTIDGLIEKVLERI